MAAEFGATPWGRAWVRTVEVTGLAAPNAQLPAGRSLARNHAVRLTVGPGRLDAEVVAAGRAQQVQIELPPWSERDRAVAEPLIAKALAGRQDLAAGDLPDSLLADLGREDIDIAVPQGELAAECDCRIRRRPCAHIVATIYALAQRIDERPALALELRSPGVQIAPPADPDWIPLTDIDPASYYGC